MTEFEKQCYGMSEQDIREQYMEGFTARLSGMEMVVMGILSDCQDIMAMAEVWPAGQAEESVRKYLNRAKFILSSMMEAKV